MGPLDDHVYWVAGKRSRNEYSAAIISGDTYAPTPAHRSVYNDIDLFADYLILVYITVVKSITSYLNSNLNSLN